MLYMQNVQYRCHCQIVSSVTLYARDHLGRPYLHLCLLQKLILPPRVPPNASVVISSAPQVRAVQAAVTTGVVPPGPLEQRCTADTGTVVLVSVMGRNFLSILKWRPSPASPV